MIKIKLIPVTVTHHMYNPIVCCLGKLWTCIENNKPQEKLLKKTKYKVNTKGFQENSSTLDWIFFSFMMNQCKSKLYFRLVEFKPAFDTVWRNGLRFKMRTKCFQYVQIMYRSIKSKLEIKNLKFYHRRIHGKKVNFCI